MIRRRGATLAVLLFATLASPWLEARSRYQLARDPASSHGARYVRDRASGDWVHLHCELRVPLARTLPDPISTDTHGDLMTVTRFTAATMGSADLSPRQSRRQDGYRIWRLRRVAGAEELGGRSSLGVQLAFDDARDAQGLAVLRREPMEIFALPLLDTLAPYQWSRWRTAEERRSAPFAGWEKLDGRAPDAMASASAPPFELRCRTVLSDVVYIAIEEEDPNLARPDPRDRPAAAPVAPLQR